MVVCCPYSITYAALSTYLKADLAAAGTTVADNILWSVTLFLFVLNTQPCCMIQCAYPRLLDLIHKQCSMLSAAQPLIYSPLSIVVSPVADFFFCPSKPARCAVDVLLSVADQHALSSSNGVHVSYPWRYTLWLKGARLGFRVQVSDVKSICPTNVQYAR